MSHRNIDHITIDVSKDFSATPNGRFYNDSPDCAEALFMMIQEALEISNHVYIEFNNLLQVGSSFLAHLARMVVSNHCSELVTVSSDCDWILRRYQKYFDIYYREWRFGL